MDLGDLYEFRSGGYRGISDGPENEFKDYGEIEDEFIISELLKTEKDRLYYTYDFSDEWRSRLDIEKVLASGVG